METRTKKIDLDRIETTPTTNGVSFAILSRELDKLKFEYDHIDYIAKKHKAERDDFKRRWATAQGKLNAIKRTIGNDHCDATDNATAGENISDVEAKIATLVRNREGKQIGQECADLMRQLRKQDPQTFTYDHLSDLFKTSIGTIANVLKGRCYP